MRDCRSIEYMRWKGRGLDVASWWSVRPEVLLKKRPLQKLYWAPNVKLHYTKFYRDISLLVSMLHEAVGCFKG
jgi:hypothetical protein